MKRLLKNFEDLYRSQSVCGVLTKHHAVVAQNPRGRKQSSVCMWMM